MCGNIISGSVAGQDWYRIHWHLRKIRSEPAFQAGFQSLYEDFFQRLGTKHATREVPDCAFFRRQVADVFGTQVDLDTSRLSVGSAVS